VFTEVVPTVSITFLVAESTIAPFVKFNKLFVFVIAVNGVVGGVKPDV
jgi:hypothetical protein